MTIIQADNINILVSLLHDIYIDYTKTTQRLHNYNGINYQKNDPYFDDFLSKIILSIKSGKEMASLKKNGQKINVQFLKVP